MMLFALHIFTLVSICVVKAVAKRPSPVTVAHESLITPAPVVYNVDEPHWEWPTSDAVPIGAQCGGTYYTGRSNCECPGKCASLGGKDEIEVFTPRFEGLTE
ncbi:hypothetical protein NMY22_g10216 [Coprinellus aureogranulatus]|nr:hypothetical protein NMY22_g10216 [Coprinellus aureogranulatus]